MASATPGRQSGQSGGYPEEHRGGDGTQEPDQKGRGAAGERNFLQDENAALVKRENQKHQKEEAKDSVKPDEFDREEETDSAFRQTRSGSAARRGERTGQGNTSAERSWDDGGKSSYSNKSPRKDADNDSESTDLKPIN